MTKIDPYVIAELSYWRSHWPAVQTAQSQPSYWTIDLTSLAYGLLVWHVTQHLESVEFRTTYSKDVIGLVARHNATCHHVDIS